MSKRVQVTLSDRRVEQLQVICAARGISESIVCRMLVMDGMDSAINRIRADLPTWRETFDEIERRYIHGGPKTTT